MNRKPTGDHQQYPGGLPGAYTAPPESLTTGSAKGSAAGSASGSSAGGSKSTTALLLVSTVLLGLMAGLFFAFDVSVMPGLAAGDEHTYVIAMRSFNKAIDGNGLFGMAFVLALLVSAASAVIEFRRGRRGVAVWVGVACVTYLIVLVITFAVNIPLNNELADAGDVAKMTDFSVVDTFKGTWVAANIMRTVLCTAALTALSRALVLYGRATR
ncbi:DUF1772 domain-containing protein [Streptomyces sp. NPDC048416]|uniref:anthrone oxygenase family protein n=1 Tax=Streptomyces sp. NPDC048416 TaxID=3365546 RepID=UPI00371FF5D3